jgi:hypothetical protein
VKEVIETMLIATADEILRKGREMGRFDLRRQQSVKRTTCLKRFRALYGSNPIVYAQIIEDLQTTHIVEARFDSKNISVEKLLIAMNFLKCYQSEEVRSGQFRVSKEEQEIDSIASGFCILSLYWPFGYDRVVLVKRLRHSFSVSLRHFTSLRQIRLRQNSLRYFQIV